MGTKRLFSNRCGLSSSIQHWPRQGGDHFRPLLFSVIGDSRLKLEMMSTFASAGLTGQPVNQFQVDMTAPYRILSLQDGDLESAHALRRPFPYPDGWLACGREGDL